MTTSYEAWAKTLPKGATVTEDREHGQSVVKLGEATVGVFDHDLDSGTTIGVYIGTLREDVTRVGPNSRASRLSSLFENTGEVVACCDPIKSRNENADLSKPARSYTQYSVHGNSFLPSSRTQPMLDSAVYKIVSSMQGTFLEKIALKSDQLVKFEDARISAVTEEIKKFWGLKKTYKEHGITHKRGVLLYGPPGSGKTSLLAQVIGESITDGNVVIMVDESSLNDTPAMLEAIAEVEGGDRCILVVMEDVDEIVGYSERRFLNLMDGASQCDGMLFLATTNYPERLPERVMRPGRFDVQLEVSRIPDTARRDFFKFKLVNNPSMSEAMLEGLVLESDGMTFAEMKEMLIRKFILGGSPIRESAAGPKGAATAGMGESKLTLDQFKRYVFSSFYVYGGNDEDDVTIEDSGQKYRIVFNDGNVFVDPDEPDRKTNRRAKEIKKQIETQEDWGQFEPLDEAATYQLNASGLSPEKFAEFKRRIAANLVKGYSEEGQVLTFEDDLDKEVAKTELLTMMFREEGLSGLDGASQTPASSSGGFTEEDDSEYTTRITAQAEAKLSLPGWSEVLRVAKDDEGVAYVVHDTIRNVLQGSAPNKAFMDAAENQNMYGDRPDIVASRKRAYDVLRSKYKINVTSYTLTHKQDVDSEPSPEMKTVVTPQIKSMGEDHTGLPFFSKLEARNGIEREEKSIEIEIERETEDGYGSEIITVVGEVIRTQDPFNTGDSGHSETEVDVKSAMDKNGSKVELTPEEYEYAKVLLAEAAPKLDEEDVINNVKDYLYRHNLRLPNPDYRTTHKYAPQWKVAGSTYYYQLPNRTIVAWIDNAKKLYRFSETGLHRPLVA